MAKSANDHLQVAVQAIQKAQAAANKELTKQAQIIASQGKRIDRQERKIGTQSKVSQSQGQDIAKLEKNVQNLRDTVIKIDLASGMTGTDVASKWSLSNGRISQIKHN